MSILGLAAGDSSGIFSFVSTQECPSFAKIICQSILTRITFSYDIVHSEKFFGHSYIFVIKKRYVFFCITELSISHSTIKKFIEEVNTLCIMDQSNIDKFLHKFLYENDKIKKEIDELILKMTRETIEQNTDIMKILGLKIPTI